MNTNDNTTPQFPANWRIAADYDPQDHMMNLKGKSYLDVQNRLLWFVRDQRDFIVRGLATTSYVIRTELIQHDREAGYAHFATYVRDVLGNEATMYGSETARDFGDYAEKASTKSLGRALAMLGYGTQYAAEMDEGERVVDTPVERRRTEPPKPGNQNAPVRASQPQQHAPTPEASAQHSQRPLSAVIRETDAQPLNRNGQMDLVRMLREAGHNTPNKIRAFLAGALPDGRVVDVDKLLVGESDLTVGEMGLVLSTLNGAQNGKAAAR